MRCLWAIPEYVRRVWRGEPVYLWIRPSRFKQNSTPTVVGKFLRIIIPHFGVARAVQGACHYTVNHHAETMMGKLVDWMVKDHWAIKGHDYDVTEMVARQYP